jgi:drug/metabolite transporter (DMT)-like permease
VLASLGYALGAFYLRRHVADAQPIGLVTATMGITAIVTLPAAVLTAPAALPSAAALGSLAALGIFGTGIAFVLFYTLISEVGPGRSSLVGYIAPGFAVLYGVVLLGEPVSAATFGGLALILLGSWLAAGGRPRRLFFPTHTTRRPLEVTR